MSSLWRKGLDLIDKFSFGQPHTSRYLGELVSAWCSLVCPQSSWRVRNVRALYALHALMTLARRYQQGASTVRDIASESDLPVKFLGLILLELKHARIVESVRGSNGGYRLRRAPSEIRLSEIIRIMDGPLAPFGDADQLRILIAGDAEHRALYQVFLDVRDSAARMLDNTTDIIAKQRNAKRNADRSPIERKSAAK